MILICNVVQVSVSYTKTGILQAYINLVSIYAVEPTAVLAAHAGVI